MQVTKPFFSIIIPTYNRARFITATIQSVLRQTYADFELIVVDDGSKDETEAIVNNFRDLRLFYYKKENGERGAARNYGIRKAKGTYVTFIDSDDLLYDNALQNAFECLKNYNFPTCFAQAYEVIRSNDHKRLYVPQVFKQEIINQYLLKGNFLSCIGVFIKREILLENGFEEDRKFAGTEDWLLWLQLSAKFPFYYSNTLCACMVNHDNRSVLNFEEDKLLYRAQHLKNKLASNEAFITKYGKKSVNHIYAHMLSYIALHLGMMSNRKKDTIKYLLKAMRVNINELFTRRTLGILKTILVK